MDDNDKWLLDQIKWLEDQKKNHYLTEEEEQLLKDLREYFGKDERNEN